MYIRLVGVYHMPSIFAVVCCCLLLLLLTSHESAYWLIRSQHIRRNTLTMYMFNLRACRFVSLMSDKLLNRYIKSQAMLCPAVLCCAVLFNLLPKLECSQCSTLTQQSCTRRSLFRRPPSPNPSTHGHLRKTKHIATVQFEHQQSAANWCDSSQT